MSARQHRAVIAGGVVGILLAGLWTYGFSLRLPLFLDDMIHFRWLAWHDFAGIWSSSRLLGYYRPLPFALWKVLWLLQGRYDPVVLHAVNLVLHMLNALLVLALVAASGQAKRLGTAVAAALLFILFPFSYQAVPWVGSLTHPLVVALILGSLVLHQAQRRISGTGGKLRGRALAVASLLLALLAPFAHETGALVAPLLFLLLITEEAPLPLRQALREVAPYAACAAVGLAVWLLVPKEIKAASPWNLESRFQNAVYFLQALAYPVVPLATRLTGPGRRLNDLAAVVIVALPAVTAWALLLWKAGRGRLVALALGWFAVCVTPAWAMLAFSYVIDGPRLMYEAAVGAALFWSIGLDVRFAGRTRQLLGAVLGALVVLWAGVSGYRFIRTRVPFYEEMRLAVAQLLEAGAGPASEAILCINYPSWFAPFEATYALGHEGMTLVPAYTRVTDLWWLHTGQERPLTSAVLPDLLSHWRYYYAVAGGGETSESLQAKLRAARRVIVTRYDGPHVAVRDAGGLEAEGQPPAASFVAGFDGQVGLLAASWERDGQARRVTLRWQCWERVTEDVTVFLHLYNEEGQLVAQADGYPLMGAGRFGAWEVGDEWRDVRVLPLPAELAPGQYALKVGIYPVSGGARLGATGPGGEHFQDEAVPIGSLRIP